MYSMALHLASTTLFGNEMHPGNDIYLVAGMSTSRGVAPIQAGFLYIHHIAAAETYLEGEHACASQKGQSQSPDAPSVYGMQSGVASPGSNKAAQQLKKAKRDLASLQVRKELLLLCSSTRCV